MKYTSKNGFKIYTTQVAGLKKASICLLCEKLYIPGKLIYNISNNPNIPKRNEESVILDIRLA